MTETEARIIITDYLKKISKETPPEYIGDDQQCYFYTCLLYTSDAADE